MNDKNEWWERNSLNSVLPNQVDDHFDHDDKDYSKFLQQSVLFFEKLHVTDKS